MLHLHFPLDASTEQALPKPYLFTLHGLAKRGERISPQTVFLSKRHAELFDSKLFVHNGIEVSDYEAVDLEQPRRGFCFLAQASRPEKNLAAALRIAEATGEPLEIMGGWRFSLKKSRRYHGMCTDERKQQLLSRTRALLFPVLWEEPFGLAPIEALLCGAPVLGTRYGALPELISPAVGKLSNNEMHLSEAAQRLCEEKKAAWFPPLSCRNYAAENFSSLKMAERYLHFYKKILVGERLHRDSLFLKEERLRQPVLKK